MFAIFEKLGGKQQALEVIERRLSWSPGKSTLKKWKRDGAISPRVGMALQAECEERGISYSLSDFRAAAPTPSEGQAA